MLFHLRDAFRAGDVWLARSRRYGDIRKALLSTPVVADADRSLPAPASPHEWLAERRFALDEGLRRLAAAARAGAIAVGSIEDSVLRVERTETAVPDGAADLVADLYRRMPEARITDILLKVDDVDRALAVVVEAQAALPMAAFWGTGRTASSDGQFFPAGGRGEALNLVNARYGTEPGVKAYSHVSERAVLDDAHDEAKETLTLTDGEAPGTIENADLMSRTSAGEPGSGTTCRPTTRAAAALDVYLEAGRTRGAKGGALPEPGPAGAPADGPGARAAGRPGDDQAARRSRVAGRDHLLEHR